MAVNFPLVFSEAYYRAQNPDVAAAIGVLQPDGVTLFTSGWDHFNRFGAAEGRSASPLFDATVYAAANPDLAEAGLTTTAQLRAHFNLYGAAEGRVAVSSQVFNLDYYKANNADLVEAGLSDAQIVSHFYEYGAREGRAATPNFSVANYKAANADLAGLSDAVARGHWYVWGAQEGRAFPQLAQAYTLTQSTNSVAEGSSITYTITSNLPLTADATFTFNVSGDTNGGTIDAATTADFGASSGTVTIGAGGTSATFTVTPGIDVTQEALEGFKVTLFNSNLAVVGTRTAIITDNSAAVGTTQSLGSTNDNLTGGAGNDTFNSVVSGDNGSGTTLQAGDVIAAAGGTADVLNVSIAGTATATVTSAAATISGVERINVSNFETSVNNNVIDLALVDSALTTLSLSSSSATGDTQFSTVGKVVAAEMSNGSGDLTISYTSAASTGTTVQSLALSNQSGGTFTANGVETINVTSSTLANTLTLAGDALTTVTVTGAVGLTLGTVPNTLTTLDASGLSASLSATLGTATSVTVTGGSGIDTLTTGAALSGGTVSGGAGADTLIVGANSHITTTAIGARYTNFETLLLNTSETVATGADFTDRSQNVGQVVGITTYGLTSLALTGASGDNTANGTLAVDFTGAASGQTLNLSGISYTDSSTDDANDDDVTLTVSSALATDGTADVLNLALSGNTTSNSGTDALTLALTLNSYETLNISSTGSSTNTIGTIAASSLKSLVISGSRAITIASLGGNTATSSIDASAATANVSIAVNQGTTASTITGGSGNDSLVGGSAADSISGGTGNDSLGGAAGNDIINGGAGNDVITGGAGIDNLSGGDGNDTFSVATAGDFQGLTAAETVDGGSGTDTLKFSAGMTIIGTDLTKVTSIEAFEFAATGTASSITLTDAYFTAAGVTTVSIVDGDATGASALTVDASGLSAANSISVTADAAAATNDSLAGGSGADTFTFTTKTSATSLTSTDTVVGGAGVDTLAVTLDTNSLTAVTLSGVSAIEKITVTGSGALTASIDLGAATVITASSATIDASGMTGTGGFTFDGSDETVATLAITGGTGADSLVGGSASDTIVGGTGADTIIGGAGVDSLTGGAGDDVFGVAAVAEFIGQTAAETVVGGDGNDTLIFDVDAATTVNSTDLSSISSIETISFTGNNTSSVTLTDAVMAANAVTSLKITDTDATAALTVNAASLSATYSVSVTANGGAAISDSLAGGAGNDTFSFTTASSATALAAADSVNGGAGTDTLAITLDTNALTAVTLTNVSNVERITVTTTANLAAAITVVDATFASVTGGVVDASGMTGSGAFTFDASAEDDSTLVITGTLNADAIVGSQKNDTIAGGSGADTITGGLGADSLTGGLGADTFVYTSAAVAASSGSTTDSINDFTSGTDKLSVTLDYSGLSSSIDVNTNSVSTVADLSAKRGEWFYDSTAGTLSINVNNDNLITTQDFKIGVGSVANGDINFTITGTAQGDSIVGGGGVDTITGGNGADSLTGGSGLDSFIVAAGATSLTIGGAGDSGTISGYDQITDFTLGTASVLSETLDVGGTAALAAAGDTNGTDSTLTIGGTAVKSHSVSAAGIVTFDDADTFATAVSLTTTAHLAAVVQYLQGNDIGNAGTTVAFIVGSDTYAFIQGDATGADNTLDQLVRLVGVAADALLTTNAVGANDLFIA